MINQHISTKSSRENRRRNNSSAGFTLFEMVVAVAIFALIGVVAFGGLAEMTRTGQAVSVANERLSDMQFAVVYFGRDWTQVSPRSIRNQFGDDEANIVLEDNSITFTRGGWTNLLGHPRSSLQRVQYLVEDNKLLRRHWRSLDQGIAEQPLEVVLIDGVEDLEIEFQNALGQPIRDWPADSNSSTGAPILLAFRLNITGIGEITRLLEVPDELS